MARIQLEPWTEATRLQALLQVPPSLRTLLRCAQEVRQGTEAGLALLSLPIMSWTLPRALQAQFRAPGAILRGFMPDGRLLVRLGPSKHALLPLRGRILEHL
jgi:hypothetical protein